MNCKSPQSVEGASAALYVYVKDVEKMFTQAAAAGATVTMPLMDAFWGDRTGQLVDPYGHVWSFATRSATSLKKRHKRHYSSGLPGWEKASRHETAIALSFGEQESTRLFHRQPSEMPTNNLIFLAEKCNRKKVKKPLD